MKTRFTLFLLLASLELCAQGIYESNVVVTTFAGGSPAGSLDGPNLSAKFEGPKLIALDGRASLVVIDHPATVRRVSIESNVTFTIFRQSALDDVSSVMVTNGNILVNAHSQGYSTATSTGFKALPWSGVFTNTGFPRFGQIASWGSNGLLVAGGRNLFQVLGPDVLLISSSFSSITSIAGGPGGVIYVADQNQIKSLMPNGAVSTVAGSVTAGYADGTSTEARFRSPGSITLDSVGNIYVADTGNNAIRIVKPDRSVRTLAGRVRGYKDGAGTGAEFSSPSGIVALDFGTVFVTDSENNAIRKITFQPPQESTNYVSGRLFYGVELKGQYGRTFRIDNATNPRGPWTVRATEMITSFSGSQLWIDPTPLSAWRFYRVVLLP